MARVGVHITGASGSGTTTLGRAVAADRGWHHVDADDIYWLESTPPYQTKRAPVERSTLLSAAIARTQSGGVVLSGSVVGWGDAVVDEFELIVFLAVPTPVRVARLRARELTRHSSVDEEFIAWAGRYDDGDLGIRSRALHEQWLSARTCPVLRIEGEVPLTEAVPLVLAALDQEQGGDPPAASARL